MSRCKKLSLPFTWLLIAVVAMLILSVIAIVLGSWLAPLGESWPHLVDVLLLEALTNTLLLLTGNIIITFILGVSLAWLVSFYDFSGRAILERLLLLPIAIPPYVLAFLVLDSVDSAGTTNQYLHALGISFSIDSHAWWLVTLTMSLVTYPYVYLLARNSFQSMQQNIVERVKLLGFSNWKMFFKVALPMARTGLVAAVFLVIMETLADFGTVSVFNFDTLTMLIYKSWFSLFDFTAAMQLAGLLLSIVLLLLLLERLSQSAARYNNHATGITLQRIPLQGFGSVLGCAIGWSVWLLSFLLPLLVLIFLVFQGEHSLFFNWQELGEIIMNTLYLAIIAALITTFVGLLFAIERFQLRYSSTSKNSYLEKGFRLLLQCAQVSYAIPGIILSISLLSVFTLIDEQLLTWSVEWNIRTLLTQSIWGLLLVYLLRFLTMAHNNLQAVLFRLKSSMVDAARTLGLNQRRLLFKLYLPVLKFPLLSSALLVFLEVAKEMPATLLMRPFNFDTLAITIFGLTQEGQWAAAALPALVLIILSLIGIVVFIPQAMSKSQSPYNPSS